MSHILIVEDEPDLAKLLTEYLEAASYSTTAISNGKLADEWLQKNNPDLIILDVMLPDMDGLTICKNLRKSSETPVIMLTARVEEIDRLLGLELGADDYICKPFSPREVVARVKSVLRRSTTKQTPPLPTSQFALNQDTFTVNIGQHQVALTSIEMRLLTMLYAEPGRIFSRQCIMDRIYTDYRVVSDRTVDSHIKKLRKKMSDVTPDTDYIRSIYGAGYTFEIHPLQEK